MTPQELKNSILQLAIQGRLVEQRPEEGTAEELFAQIQAEKRRLVKEGKIKKEKPLPEITEEEKPFEIPESWMWIHLGKLVRVIGGVSYKKGDVGSSGIRILRGGNIQSMKIILDEDDVFLPFSYKETEKQIQTGDILIVASTGSKSVIGKAGYVDKEYPDTMIGAFLRICRPLYLPTVEYLRYLFGSDFYRKHIRDLSQGTNINNVKESYITEFVIPLPPLAEQKRIVAKIEELLPLVDRYEQAWSKLEQFNIRFPEDMKKSLLQQAIQGKLVEQRPEEGTAEELFAQIQAEKRRLIKAGKIKKEKPLPEITEEEKPFDIPESWMWVRWGDLSQSIQYGYNAPAQESGRIKMVRISDIQGGKVLWDSVPYCEIKEDDISTYLLGANDILFARTGGTVGKSYLVREVPEEAIYAGYLIRTRYSSLLCPEYLKYFMESQLYWGQLRNGTIATAQPNCNGKTLSKMVLPLPPLAEQKRIVEKLEQLLPLCERLK